MSPECKLMHIDRAHQITVSREPTGAACPISPFGLMTMPTARTLATCSSFGASEARDVSLFGFMSEIVDVFAIFPQGHTLMVVSAIIPIAHAVGIANKQGSYLILNAKVDDLPGGLMTQITDPPFTAFTYLIFGTLQFLPAARGLLAARLLLGDLANTHGTLSFERADQAPSDDHRLACIGANRRQMVE